MITVTNLSKNYGQTVALDNVNLDFKPGQTTVLIGPSGCGKSSLLRSIVGLVVPDAGEVSVHGQKMTERTLSDIRLKTGYLIQEGGLFPHLTCRQNITLVAEQEGISETDTKISELLKLVRLDESVLDRYPSQVSGGQRQRVALMRSLFLSPDVLLLDEPLGALDPLIRNELQTDLREIFQQLGKTVLLVTHDLAEAAHFADVIVLMRDGRIEQTGSFRALVETPVNEYVNTFVAAQKNVHSTEVRA
ncbi:MAG: ATP-binding cassette domain-containing protein [Planctomycetota bacterium]